MKPGAAGEVYGLAEVAEEDAFGRAVEDAGAGQRLGADVEAGVVCVDDEGEGAALDGQHCIAAVCQG